jgi:hypothetical protein
MGDANSQLDGLWDTCAAAILNTWDAYSWVVPALLLTLLFFGAIALICFALQDLDFDAPLIEAPVAIFRWSRKTFQSQRLQRISNRKGRFQELSGKCGDVKVNELAEITGLVLHRAIERAEGQRACNGSTASVLRIRCRSRVIGFVARLCCTNVISEFVTAEVVRESRIALR